MERKVKYTFEFKLECIKLVLEKHNSINYVSRVKVRAEPTFANGLSSTTSMAKLDYYQGII